MQRFAVFQSNDPQVPAEFLDVKLVPNSTIFHLNFMTN